MYFGANTVMELQLSYWLVVPGLQVPRAQFCWIYSRMYHSLEDFSWTFSWLYAMCCLYAICFSALSLLFHVLAQNCFNLCKLWPYFQGRKLLKSVKFCYVHFFPANVVCLRYEDSVEEFMNFLCPCVLLCIFVFPSDSKWHFLVFPPRLVIWCNSALQLVKFERLYLKSSGSCLLSLWSQLWSEGKLGLQKPSIYICD